MNCCIECFSDSEIRKVIESVGMVGNCDYCGSNNTKILSKSEKSRIGELLGSVIDIYHTSIPSSDGKLLKNALTEDWNIFSGSPDMVQAIITEFCTTRFENDARIFFEPVYTLIDDDYLSEYGITRQYTWKEFSRIMKHENRFHNNIFNPDAFASFLTYAIKQYPVGTKMYRARLGFDRNGIPIDKLNAPPPEKRSAGRINPEGVSVLYLSSRAETALYEVRASMHDYVTVGEFNLKDNIRVISLEGISTISPFVYLDMQRYAANRACLQEIASVIAKPLRRNDSTLEYLPSQFISEFIKHQGYDGVEYLSTMTTNGYNCAIFDASHFECVGRKVYEIKELSYSPEEVNFGI